MAIALTLLQERDTNRELYLFDTFEGMTPPNEKDKSWDNTPAEKILQVNAQLWCVAGLDEVQNNMAATAYPAEHVHFVKGDVRMTIPAPTGPIALLRLDTDFYDSTKHELIHLFPSLVQGGIMMIDDYGHWKGSRQAVDEYFAAQPRLPYLHRIDFSGRSMVKS